MDKEEKIWVEICPQEDQVLFHTSKDLSQNVHSEIMSNLNAFWRKKIFDRTISIDS